MHCTPTIEIADGEVSIRGSSEQLEALGQLLILKAKMGDNLDATMKGGGWHDGRKMDPGLPIRLYWFSENPEDYRKGHSGVCDHV